MAKSEEQLPLLVLWELRLDLLQLRGGEQVLGAGAPQKLREAVLDHLEELLAGEGEEVVTWTWALAESG